MKRFMFSEKYRLEIRWKKVTYLNDQSVKLEGCYLTGPVIKEVWQLQDEDYINLDFAKQFAIFLDRYYVATLRWKGVRHTPNQIFLDNVTFNHNDLSLVPKLTDADYIVIDTKDHENEKHMYNLFYKAYLLKKDGTLYDFGSISHA